MFDSLLFFFFYYNTLTLTVSLSLSLSLSLSICLTLTLQLWCLIRVIFNLPSAETSRTAMQLFSRIAMHTGGRKKERWWHFAWSKLSVLGPIVHCFYALERGFWLDEEREGLPSFHLARHCFFLCSRVSLPATCSITPPQWATMQLHDQHTATVPHFPCCTVR